MTNVNGGDNQKDINAKINKLLSSIKELIVDTEIETIIQQYAIRLKTLLQNHITAGTANDDVAKRTENALNLLEEYRKLFQQCAVLTSELNKENKDDNALLITLKDKNILVQQEVALQKTTTEKLTIQIAALEEVISLITKNKLKKELDYFINNPFKDDPVQRQTVNSIAEKANDILPALNRAIEELDKDILKFPGYSLDVLNARNKKLAAQVMLLDAALSQLQNEKDILNSIANKIQEFKEAYIVLRQKSDGFESNLSKNLQTIYQNMPSQGLHQNTLQSIEDKKAQIDELENSIVILGDDLNYESLNSRNELLTRQITLYQQIQTDLKAFDGLENTAQRKKSAKSRQVEIQETQPKKKIIPSKLKISKQQKQELETLEITLVQKKAYIEKLHHEISLTNRTISAQNNGEKSEINNLFETRIKNFDENTPSKDFPKLKDERENAIRALDNKIADLNKKLNDIKADILSRQKTLKNNLLFNFCLLSTSSSESDKTKAENLLSKILEDKKSLYESPLIKLLELDTPQSNFFDTYELAMTAITGNEINQNGLAALLELDSTNNGTPAQKLNNQMSQAEHSFKEKFPPVMEVLGSKFSLNGKLYDLDKKKSTYENYKKNRDTFLEALKVGAKPNINYEKIFDDLKKQLAYLQVPTQEATTVTSNRNILTLVDCVERQEKKPSLSSTEDLATADKQKQLTQHLEEANKIQQVLKEILDMITKELNGVPLEDPRIVLLNTIFHKINDQPYAAETHIMLINNAPGFPAGENNLPEIKQYNSLLKTHVIKELNESMSQKKLNELSSTIRGRFISFIGKILNFFRNMVCSSVNENSFFATTMEKNLYNARVKALKELPNDDVNNESQSQREPTDQFNTK